MKTVILCGGRGTRLGEHGATIPKALIEIGGQPILWHLLKLYAHQGFNDFILCLGFLGDEIKNYFVENENTFKIEFVDTGLDTNTGGRIKRIEHLIDNETFFATYGDGLSDLNLNALLDFHQSHKRLATLTAVHPHSNFGIMKLNEESAVIEFQEKPRLREWINGGFFVFNRKVFDFLEEDSILEREPLERLANERQLIAYQHTGFWKCMDTYKDNMEFNQLWDSNQAAWKIWQ
jgi:glucose-1-phosphate cytidylyltransferase